MKHTATCLSILLAVGAQPLLAQDLPLELPERTPAGVMSYRGAGWLERPERVAEEMPEEVMATLGLADGDVVADLGAGSGYYTRRMARRVEPSGTVYAVDIQPEMLDILRDNMAREGITNVVPVLSEPDDPLLPDGEIDWIFLADVYHELADPVTMLARMRDALNDQGRVALLEYRVEDGSGDHILAAHRMSVRQVMLEWNAAGFELVELHEFLPAQHLFVLQKESGSRETIRHVDLLEASATGLVNVTVRGNGEQAVTAAVRRTVAEPLVVTFPVGTYYVASGGATDMVALRDGAVLLTDDEPHIWSAPARRARPTGAAPSGGDALRVEAADEHRRERNVMWVFQGLDFPPAVAPVLEQLALFIASADAGYEDLAAHLEGVPLPAANGVALALAYVESAGIDETTTRLWSERELFVPSISDPSLRALFDNWGL